MSRYRLYIILILFFGLFSLESKAQCDDTLSIDSIITPFDTSVVYVLAPKPLKSFTPNGDGWNDSWVIPGIIEYPNFLLQVYNRWGQRVYHQRDQYIEWNGKVGEIDVPSGNYYFVFYPDKDDEQCYIPGNVVVIR